MHSGAARTRTATSVRANKATYDYYYGAYVATYPALRPLMHQMADRVASPSPQG